MKKTVFLTMFLIAALCGFAQQPLYDFSAISESGQILYFKKLFGESQKVMVTYPSFEYSEHPKPQGELIIPTTVTYNDTIYTVTRINYNTFFSCDSLTSVVFSDSLETIGDGAFGQCTSLNHISAFPETLTDLGSNTFYYCYQLQEPITIPAQITELKSTVFKNSGITAIHIPAGVVRINRNAFSGCRLLRSIVVDDANPVYDSRKHCNALIETATNTLFLGCENTKIPFGVTSIASGAFFGCDSLYSIILPSSVSYIEDQALACSSLTSIISHSSVPPTAVFEVEPGVFYHNSFMDVDMNIPIYVPSGSINAYKAASGWNYFHQFIEQEIYYNGEWYYEITNANGSITYQYLQCEGDTTINNERPKIIVRTNTIYDKDKKTEVTHEYVYENNGIVYWWNKELQQFTTLYDLTAEEGDEWEIKVGTETLLMHVDGVEAYEHDGETYKMLHVSDAGQIFTGDIVVGIGHLTSFFPERLMNKNKDFRVDGLRCYWVGDALLYHQGDEDCDVIYSNFHGVDEINTEGFLVYPNPAKDVLTIHHSAFRIPHSEFHITNLLGQTVMTGTLSEGTIDVSDLPKGMYFVAINNQSLKFVKL